MNINKLIVYLFKAPSLIRQVNEIKQAYDLHHFLESIDMCNQLIESFPYSKDGYYFKGLNLIELKLYDDALENFKIARQIFRKNRFVKILQEQSHDISIGICRSYLGKRLITEAIEEINHTIDQFPKAAKGYLMKAEIYSAGDDYINAIDTLNIGLKYNKRNKSLIEYKNRLTCLYTEKIKENKK